MTYLNIYFFGGCFIFMLLWYHFLIEAKEYSGILAVYEFLIYLTFALVISVFWPVFSIWRVVRMIKGEGNE